MAHGDGLPSGDLLQNENVQAGPIWISQLARGVRVEGVKEWQAAFEAALDIAAGGAHCAVLVEVDALDSIIQRMKMVRRSTRARVVLELRGAEVSRELKDKLDMLRSLGVGLGLVVDSWHPERIEDCMRIVQPEVAMFSQSLVAMLAKVKPSLIAELAGLCSEYGAETIGPCLDHQGSTSNTHGLFSQFASIPRQVEWWGSWSQVCQRYPTKTAESSS